MFACIHAVADPLPCVRAFSPRVEQTAPYTVVLDISGLDHLFGTPRQIAETIMRRAGFEVNVAVAANPDAAICAARGFSGITVIPPGAEAGYLARLPLKMLSPSPELEETLQRWGIRTFHDLAALPEPGLAERLGQEGLRLHRLARGANKRPLKPVEEAPHFEEELELEHPVELLEPLSFLLARLLNDLCARLDATTEVRLHLQLEDQTDHTRTLRLPVPMRDPKIFLKLLHLDLSSHPPRAPIVKIRLAAESAKPRVAQTGLFLPVAPEPEKLELTLARIAALVGEENVGSPELLDTHRPHAFRLTRFSSDRHSCLSLAAQQPHLTLRLLRSPRPIPDLRNQAVAAAGPWRTSGDWWTKDPWARDEWDIQLHDGTLCRIYREQGRWFLEGVYD
jgi:protein ImuB